MRRTLPVIVLFPILLIAASMAPPATAHAQSVRIRALGEPETVVAELGQPGFNAPWQWIYYSQGGVPVTAFRIRIEAIDFGPDDEWGLQELGGRFLDGSEWARLDFVRAFLDTDGNEVFSGGSSYNWHDYDIPAENSRQDGTPEDPSWVHYNYDNNRPMVTLTADQPVATLIYMVFMRWGFNVDVPETGSAFQLAADYVTAWEGMGDYPIDFEPFLSTRLVVWLGSAFVASANPLIDDSISAGTPQAVLADVAAVEHARDARELLSLTVQRTAGDPDHIVGLELVLDADNDGAPGPDDPVLDVIDAGFRAGDTVTFWPRLPAGPVVATPDAPLRLLVVAILASALKDAMTFSVAVTGMQVDPGGDATGDWPLVSGARTVTTPRHPLLRIHLDAPAATARPGEQVVAGSLHIDALEGPATVRAVKLRAVGSANDATAIEGISLAIDRGYAGSYEPDRDLVVASGRFDRDDAGLRLETSPIGLIAGGRCSLLVLVTLSDAARPGEVAGFVVREVVTAEERPVEGLEQSASGGLTVIGESDDPEFDPAPVGPFDIAASGAGCQAGGGGPVLPLLALAALAVTARRRTLPPTAA